MSALSACEVPVFSYAMQYWTAVPYRVYIFHDGEPSESEARLIEQFKAVAVYNTLETNMTVEAFNLNELADAALLELHRAYLYDTTPGVLVLYPVSSRITRPVYAGPLTDTLLRELVDSPARRAVAGNLAAGNVAVWVLLESGNRREDNAAADLLKRELRRMEQVLQLPAIELWAWSDTLRAAAKDGKGVRFSIIRVARNTPEEDLFIRMLLHSEPDLPEMDKAPIVFPIYGRGLILYALVGAGINEWTIADACEFIVGPCSCQAKASNPGTDLLLSINWSQHIGTTRYDKPAPLAGFSDFFERGKVAATQIAADQHNGIAPEETAGNAGTTVAATPSRHYAWMVGGVLTGGIVAGLFFYVTYTQTTGKEPK